MDKELFLIELSKLDAEELLVLKLRFYKSKSYDKIAKIFKVTRERVRQREGKAMRRLRRYYQKSKIESYRELFN